MNENIKITWATRAFADYRLPVFTELNRLSKGNLTVIYNKEIVKKHISDQLISTLGNRAIGLYGEKRLIGKNRENAAFANSGIRIPIQKDLVSTIKNTNPDVLISDGFFQWTYGSLFVNMTRKIPHIMCYERTAHTERNVQWYRVLYRKLAMKWIDYIICSGSQCGQYVKSLGFPGSQLSYGHMVADVKALAEKATAISENEILKLKEQFQAKYIFLYTGQIIKRKGIKELVEAWQESNLQNNSEVALVLIGDGNQFDEIKQLVQSSKTRNIHILGRVPYNQIATYYAFADLFIIPTLEDNWSLVVPEAMATSLPIACSKYNGLWPEMIKPENGWVFDPLDKNKFISALHMIFADRDSFNSMGKSSRQIVQQHTPEKAAKIIWQTSQKATSTINEN
ncbi:MAG: glycosyltransferase family 4 protein [Bacteroidetes bacterium]|nr:glycosyltransferase family 4 protein [Bacteroidota bacterium]